MPFYRGVAQQDHFTFYTREGLFDPVPHDETGRSIGLGDHLHKLGFHTTLELLEDAITTRDGQSLGRPDGVCRWVFLGAAEAGWNLQLRQGEEAYDFVFDGDEISRAFTLSADHCIPAIEHARVTPTCWEATELREAVSGRGYIADIAVGGDAIYAVGGHGGSKMVVASSNGCDFHGRRTPETPGLRGVCALPDGRILVVGEHGMLAVSSNEAASWQRVTTPSDDDACFMGVVRAENGDIWVGTTAGGLYCSTDGGSRFASVALPHVVPFTGMCHLSGRTFFLGRNGALLVHDGEHFTTSTPPTSKPLCEMTQTASGA